MLWSRLCEGPLVQGTGTPRNRPCSRPSALAPPGRDVAWEQSGVATATVRSLGGSRPIVGSSVTRTTWSPSTMTGQVSKTVTPSKRHVSLRRYSTNLVPRGRSGSGPTSTSEAKGAVPIVGDGDDASRRPGGPGTNESPAIGTNGPAHPGSDPTFANDRLAQSDQGCLPWHIPSPWTRFPREGWGRAGALSTATKSRRIGSRRGREKRLRDVWRNRCRS